MANKIVDIRFLRNNTTIPSTLDDMITLMQSQEKEPGVPIVGYYTDNGEEKALFGIFGNDGKLHVSKLNLNSIDESEVIDIVSEALSSNDNTLTINELDLSVNIDTTHDSATDGSANMIEVSENGLYVNGKPIKDKVRIGSEASNEEGSVLIDSTIDNAIDIYTKEEVDGMIDSVRFDETKLTEINNKIDSLVKVKDDYETKTSAIIVDETVENNFDIYTREQVDALIDGIKIDSDIVETVEYHSGLIEQNISSIAKIGTSITSIEKKIDGIDSSVVAQVNANTSSIASINGTLGDISVEVGDNTTAITKNTNSITTLNGKVTKFETDTIPKVEQNAEDITDLSNELGGKINNAIRIGTTSSNEQGNILIDTSVDSDIEVYTKEQTDAKVESVRFDETKLDKINGKIDNLVRVGTSSSNENGELFIDTSVGTNVEVYTKDEVNALFLKLKSLNPSLVWN